MKFVRETEYSRQALRDRSLRGHFRENQPQNESRVPNRTIECENLKKMVRGFFSLKFFFTVRHSPAPKARDRRRKENEIFVKFSSTSRYQVNESDVGLGCDRLRCAYDARN